MRLKNHPEIKELRDLPIRAAELGNITEEERDAEIALMETLEIDRVMGTVKELSRVLSTMITTVRLANKVEALEAKLGLTAEQAADELPEGYQA